MPTIKVQHNDEIRQFAVSSHSTWAEFSSTLRAIFSISPSTEVFLSYTDEEGDEVTLSSDVELIELFNQYVPEGGPVNFTLKTAEEIEQNEEDGVVIPNNKNSVSNSRKSSVCELSEKGWVLEGISGHEIVVNKSKLEDDESSYDGEFENIDEDRKSVDIESRSENGGLSQEHTEDTEERAPLLHGESRAEVDAPSEEEKTDLPDTEIPPSSPPPSAPNSDPTLDDLTQQLQSLVNQFQEFFVQNPQIMDTANRLMNDVVESVKGDVETFGEWLKDMKRQIEENILKGTDVNANSNRTRNTGEASQHAYTPTYTPSARSDGACREIPFLSGMPGNVFNSQCTNNEERSSDQAKDELPRQRCHPHHWNANPYQRHNSHPPPFHPSHRSPHNLPQFPRSPHGHPSPPPPPPPPPPPQQQQQHSSSHFTSDPFDHPNLPSSFTAPPPPPPPPPIPKHTTQEQQEILPGTVPYVHEIFKSLGTRLGISNNSANEDASDNMDYSPSHGPPRYFAYQTPDGDIRCGRGPFGGPKFGRSEYPGTSFGNVMDDNSSVNKADKTERTNSEHFERSEIDDKNVQDFVLAPDDLLADIRLLREMGFTQPTRELENLFRRNDNNIDEVLSILLEETENRY